MVFNEQVIQVAQKIIPTLYPYQLKLFKNNDNEIIINKSRQIGISYSIALWALLQAVLNEKTELIISPSLRQSKHMMDYVYQHLKKLEKTFNIHLREETKTSIIFENRGEIHSLPNSANTVRGYRADDIYVDEFAHFTNGTDKEIIDALTPSLSRGGNIRYISTPFGDQNVFYEYWHNRKGINRIRINYRECPDISKEKTKQIHDIIGVDAFNQEYENMFLSDMQGQEFPLSLIQSCINPELEYQELEKNIEYIGGADIGREKDLTAVIILQKQGDKYILIHKKTMSQIPYNMQQNYFEHILSNYRFTGFTMDESGIGNMLAENISQNHPISRITFNNENKQELVGNLKKIMQEKRLIFPDDIQLVNSIRAIQRIYTPSNYLRFDSVRNSEIGHADLFWALALAVYEHHGGTGDFYIG